MASLTYNNNNLYSPQNGRKVSVTITVIKTKLNYTARQSNPLVSLISEKCQI